MKRGDNMARKSKPLTPLQKAYRKERNRILQFIRRAEKRGYQFKENIVPKRIPDKISTRDVERLKRKTPEQLYKKAVYGGELTYGEIVSGEKGKKLERKRATERAAKTRKQREALRQKPEPIPIPQPEPDDWYTTEDVEEDYFDYYEPNEDTSFFDRVVIQNYKAILLQYNKMASDMLMNWINSVIRSQGEHETAIMIQKAAEAGIHLERKDSYDPVKVLNYTYKMMDFLGEAGDFTKAEIMEAMEYEESYEEPQ